MGIDERAALAAAGVSRPQAALPQRLVRRNRRTAMLLLLLACGFYGAFFWSMSHLHA